jgi:hypothetical protein
MSHVRATIEANSQKFLSAFQRGDAAGVAALPHRPEMNNRSCGPIWRTNFSGAAWRSHHR